MSRRTDQRPRFVCDGCGGVIVAASRLVDAVALEARHAASCPGPARLRSDPSQDPGRERWGEKRVAEYAARIEAARIARRMPQRRVSENHPSLLELGE